MNKKLILSLSMSVFAMLALASCNAKHEHKYDNSFQHDSNQHWKVCEVNGCNEISGKEDHHGGTATCTELAKCEDCGESYGSTLTHAYTESKVEEKYLVSGADCDSAAVYYKSCVCGEKGTETFTSGEVLGHSFSTIYTSDGTHHWSYCTREGCTTTSEKVAHSGGTATETSKAVCSVCNTPYGELLTHTHTFTKQVESASYLASAATCTANATYYYGCISEGCSSVGTTTWTKANSALGHDTEIKHDTTQHWEECVRENCDYSTTKENHRGGSATTTEKAVCSVCNAPYGELANHEHTHTKQVEDSAYLASAATCTEDATYYYACTEEGCTSVGTTTWTKEDSALGHDFSGEYITDENKHWHICERINCDETDSKIAHSGGTADCENAGSCTACGEEYLPATGHDETGAWIETEDGESHYKVCGTCNEEINYANHSGGTATVIDYPKCEICNNEYGEKLAEQEDKHVILTAESLLGYQGKNVDYGNGSKVVDNVAFDYYQVGAYGKGIQMKNADNITSLLYNSSKLGIGIKSIELTYFASELKRSNENFLKVEFADNADFNEPYVAYVSTVEGTITYTVTPDVETYQYVRFQDNLTYSMYWESINITYVHHNVHTYDKQYQIEDAVAVEGDCETSTVYYYSCLCGLINNETGASTFEGAVGSHVYDEWTINETSHSRTCTICSTNDPQNGDHTGGTPTPTSKPICDVCGSEYGNKLVSDAVTTETIVFKDLGFENAQDVSSVSTTSTLTTITMSKIGSNGNKYYNSGSAIRMYGGENWTITWDQLKQIESIVLTSSSSNAIGNGYQVTGGTDSLESGVLTITNITGNSVVIANTNSSGHFRIASVQINYVVTHTHEYSIPGKDSTEHWNECSCGDKTQVVGHDEVTASCTEDAVCSCGYVVATKLGHDVEGVSWTVKVDDETNHVQICKTCSEIVNEETHEIKEATCTEDAICKCGEVLKEATNHNYENVDWSIDSNEHWKVCANGCGTKGCVGEHELGEEATDEHGEICSVCELEYTGKVNHECKFEIDYDSEKHWEKCSCLKIQNEQPHNFQYSYRNENGALKYVESCECGYEKVVSVDSEVIDVDNENDLKTVLTSGYNAKLIEDIELTSTIELEGEIEVELDLNGKTLSLHRENPKANENVEVIRVKSGAKLTIKGEGTLSATSGEDTNVEHYVGVVSSTDGAYVRIENGSFYSNGCTVIYATKNGVVDIYGGRFEATEKYDGRLFTLDINEAETEGLGVIKVYGGTYVNFDPAKDAVDGKGNENKVQEGYCSVKVDNTYVVDEHKYTSKVTEPTCTDDGYTTHTCSRCNHSYTDSEVTSGHKIVEDKAVEATCTATGLTRGEHCENCDYVVAQEVVAAKGHSYEKEVTEPTCAEGGYTTHTCSGCGDAYTSDEVDATGEHKYSTEWEISQDGKSHVIACEDCGEVQTSELHYGGTPSSTSGAVCTVCHSVYSDIKPIDVTTKIEIATVGKENGWTEESKQTKINIDENIEATIVGGNNSGKYYDDIELRIYQTENPQITIKANEGYTLVSVKIKYNIKNGGTLTYNGTNKDSNTLIEVNNTSVTFGVGNTGTATNGQVKILEIEVVYGDKLDCTHSNVKENVKDTSGTTHSKICTSCDTKINTTTCSAINEATCFRPTTCSCGREIGTVKLEHDLVFDNNDTHHWEVCTREGCEYKTEEEKHFGGTATETEQATCEECGQKYGGLDHTHEYIQNVDNKYLASVATCDSAPAYYKSCSCGEVGTETFVHGSSLGHIWGEYEDKGEYHARSCTRDNCKEVEEDEHSGSEICICGKIMASEVTATLTFDNTSKRTEYTASIQVWEENGITFTNNKSSSTSNVADYSKPARLYKDSKVTVKVDGNITKIEFDCNSSSYATALKDSIKGATVSVSGDKVTVVLDGTSNEFIIEKLTGGQVRIDGVTVTYI